MKALKYLAVLLVAGVASAQSGHRIIEWHTATGGNESWFQDQGIAFRDADARAYVALSAICQLFNGYLTNSVTYSDPHFCESRSWDNHTEWKCGSRAFGYCSLPSQ